MLALLDWYMYRMTWCTYTVVDCTPKKKIDRLVWDLILKNITVKPFYSMGFVAHFEYSNVHHVAKNGKQARQKVIEDLLNIYEVIQD